MRKALRLPVVVLVLVLLVALAATGLAYGLWAKTLNIEGEVSTGYLHARWSGAICTEFHPWPWDIGTVTLGEVEGKDVGWTTWGVDPNDSNLLWIEAFNTYPSYSVDCEVEFTNDGTIPWKIRGIQIIPGQGLTGCEQAGTPQNALLECDQMTIELFDGIGSQYHPGETAAESLRFHVEQPADMFATYSFAVQACVAQWNEEATGEYCFAMSP